MINGITSYESSGETGYLRKQIDSVNPDKFSDCAESMLFLGCGDGEAINSLAAKYKGWRFTGVDFNDRYIEKAKSNAPSNVRYIHSSFEELEIEESFGVIASCGLLSWIEDSALNAVFGLLAKNLEPGGYASFGFDNQFFWSELIPIREIFLSQLIETGDENVARFVAESIVKTMPFSSNVKRMVANDMVTNDIHFRHWLMQPTWRPFFPSDIIMRMHRAGLRPVVEKSFGDIAIENSVSPEIYTHWEFRKR